MTSKQVVDSIKEKINKRNNQLLISLGKVVEEEFIRTINEFNGSYLPTQVCVCAPLGVIPYQVAKAYLEGYGYEVREFRCNMIRVSVEM